MANQTQDDGLGTSDPTPRDEQLGAETFGDEAADNHDDAKIVDYPAHAEDINADISSGDERTSGADR
jgi:hypothetical protein